MSFIYTLVARSADIVLVEFTDYSGNFQQISRSILNKIKPETKGKITSGNKQFTYVNENGLTTMSLTEEISNEVVFAFLYDLMKTLNNQYSYDKISKLNAYGLENFSSEIKDLMDYFSTQPSTTKLGSLVDDYKDISCPTTAIHTFLNKDVTLTVVTKNDEEDNLNLKHKNVVSSLVDNTKLEEYNEQNKKKVILIIIGFIAFMVVTSFL